LAGGAAASAGAAAASAALAVALAPASLFVFFGGMVLWWLSAVFDRKNRCRGPLRVGSTCNVGEKLATYAHVGDISG
jgi:hypothetical protein